MNKLFCLAVVTMLVGMLLASPVSAQEHAVSSYKLHYQLTSAGKVVVSEDVVVRDGVRLVQSGVSRLDSRVGYEVAFTPLKLSTGMLRLKAEYKATTQLDHRTVTSGGKTLELPNSAVCVLAPSMIIPFGKEVSLGSSSGLDAVAGSKPMPGCALSVIANKS
ncbi:MAG: hypothetical protein EPN61_18155 [Burkholderiaceae bacterium]|nr:MAG: hypothetical protein EPN61_18155 [Burkholderiaceae bacterium]